ncbi:ATP-dependent nuclease [Burkholderia sp. MSMB1835]|uniref:ATP-dependent nuclease n=1 Tax=Burkholderia sp. MSMB1835 TaxID=1637876 RepID=UPI0009E9B60E|nr:AAA family ATPase [Burkholderia sp. MSMB1835]
MYITKIDISNYRSFADATEIPLQPGMNLLLGENNSGKSTVLQALSFDSIAYEPHLSLKTKPSPSSAIRTEQRIGIEISIEKSEVWKYLGEQALLPIPSSDMIPSLDFPNFLRETDSLDIGFELLRKESNVQIDFFLAIQGQKFSAGRAANQMIMAYRCPPGENLQGGAISNYGTSAISTLIDTQWNSFKTKLYKFRAERLNVYRCPFGASTILNPDASNLAECLNSMQSQQPDLFEEYVRYVNKIFPTVHRIQSVAVPNNQMLEIRTWLTPATSRRFDLSIPLSQAGTGVSQVLAILYVAMISLEPIVIGIDEPNSFLHPKAVRSLLQILNTLTIRHQYIITTHSPEVIRSSAPESIAVVLNNGGTSLVQKLDPSNIEHIKEGLASIGARLSDVYGADEILWVEGETEELTFPKIALHVANLEMVGVAVLKVNATGDFDGGRRVRPRMVFDTYKNLSNAGSLIPPAIGFIFDKEERNQRDIDDLIKESGGSVIFLDRRCYENYLLHPDAISSTLSSSIGIPIDTDNVKKWIIENGNTQKYIDPAASIGKQEHPWQSLDWLQRVNAPKLLRDIFASIPEQPEEYRKTTHSVALTDWLLANAPDQLTPIADLLKGCFSATGE